MKKDSSRRFIIRIGMQKTGTTAIGKFMSLNRLIFEKFGIYIPKTGMGSKYDGHHNIAWELHGKTPLFKAKFGTLRDLKKELSAIDHRTVVISSDYFECFYDDADKLKKLKDFAGDLNMKTYIFVCFRKEAEYIPMIYGELLKGGLTMDFKSFVDRIIESGKIDFKGYGGWGFCFDYNKIISGFSSVFGEEFVKIFDFIPPVEMQFLKLLNIESTKGFIFPDKVNQPVLSFIMRVLRPYNIIAKRFKVLNLIRRFGTPLIRCTMKILVTLCLFLKVSSATVELDSSQKQSIMNRFSFLPLSRVSFD